MIVITRYNAGADLDSVLRFIPLSPGDERKLSLSEATTFETIAEITKAAAVSPSINADATTRQPADV